jgi:hypothetical protein
MVFAICGFFGVGHHSWALKDQSHHDDQENEIRTHHQSGEKEAAEVLPIRSRMKTPLGI